MEMNKATVTLFLDKRIPKKDGRFPLKITIYCKPDKKRYGTKLYLSEDEWKKLNSQRLKDDQLKEIKLSINSMLRKANKIIDSMSAFSFIEFERKFFVNSISRDRLKISDWFKEYISELNHQGRIGSERAYRTALNSLLMFKGDIRINEIDNIFLQEYETYLRKEGKSPSTIGVYFRHLRSIVNRAIKAGMIKHENYPFKGFDIPAARNIKKALTDEELKMLLAYIPERKDLSFSHDFWVLSYLCNGMNMVDILYLEKGSIDTQFLSFYRQKTIRTKKKDLRPIKVALHPRALEIIERRKCSDPNSKYLFPILEEGLAPVTVKNRTQRFIKQVNSGMEEIRIELGIDKKCTTYAARHTFSTRLMRKGISTQYIKESLGHSSVATTENYLSDFSDQEKLAYTSILTDF